MGQGQLEAAGAEVAAAGLALGVLVLDDPDSLFVPDDVPPDPASAPDPVLAVDPDVAPVRESVR